MRYDSCFKQFLDYLLSLLLILLLSPIMLVICIIVKLDSQGPVLFRQKRIGKDKNEFYIYKFRTMIINTPKDLPTHLFQDPKNYITKSGVFLRKSSLDELPQLFNILKGEMSFIGPRPALWNQYDLITARGSSDSNDVDANSIKPGITGWAQVNGRDEIAIDRKAVLDKYYVKNISFLLDIKIFFMTLINVLIKKDISEGGPKS